ncbi:Ammonium transporter NrgA [compost metagenome]
MTMGGQIQVQLIGIVATVAYTAILTWIILKVVGMITAIRVTAEEENTGLDIVLHDERGYDL